MARSADRRRRERDAIRAEVHRRARWWIFAAAVAAVAVGLVGLLLPERSLQLISLVLGVYFVAAGVTRAGAAYDAEAPPVRRAIVAFLGVAVVGAGVLCLNHPFRELTALDMLIGGALLLDGLACVGLALLRRTRDGAGSPIVTGAVSIGAGLVIVIARPATLGALLTIAAICLLEIGLAALAALLLTRRRPQRG